MFENNKKTEQVLTIIAPNIKTGGGKELLEYLLNFLEKNYVGMEVIAYLDQKVGIKSSHNRKVIIVNTTYSKILIFTKKFQNVIYFGNLPPMVAVTDSLVYFHNTYLLMSLKKLFSNKNSNTVTLIKEMLKQFYIRLFIRNVSNVACQTDVISESFKLKYSYKNIKTLPFFRSCETTASESEFDFCYISLAHPHKNHQTLFDALVLLGKENINFSIAVTIELDKKYLIDKINHINSSGNIRIINFGILDKNEVCELYSKSKSLIYPSLEESFGLPLVEAAELGLDIIASDLEYVFQVVKPSLTFDPNSAKSIAQTMKKYINGQYEETILTIHNNIDKIVGLVIKDEL